jgi:hypothetical protein
MAVFFSNAPKYIQPKTPKHFNSNTQAFYLKRQGVFIFCLGERKIPKFKMANTTKYNKEK